MRKYNHGGDVFRNTNILLDFSVNTNPLGMPDSIKKEIVSNIDNYCKYPDAHCEELCTYISKKEDIDGKWIVCGNGAADLIYRLCYALKPNTALICSPTFSMYQEALEQTGCEVHKYILKADNNFDLDEPFINNMTALRPDILFLCNPNNPSGRLISQDMLLRIIDIASSLNTIVVLDECFIDFTSAISCVSMLNNYKNLVILKAFTKMYAMAGLRLGYVLSSNIALLDSVYSASQCWSVSYPAQVAGIAALKDNGFVEKTRALVKKEREYLSSQLHQLSSDKCQVKVYPSSANFILFECSLPLYEQLKDEGILIRACNSFEGLNDNFYRIGVKTRLENEILINNIKKVIYG